MPIKKTKESDLNNSKKIDKNVESKIISKKDQKTIEKNAKKSANKVVIKRRKIDLKPTKASAVAIVSHANRAKKQALIEKVANSDIIPVKKTEDNRIPIWVWVFFGCSLMLFCISFYQAIIRPQLEVEIVEIPGIEDSLTISESEKSISDNDSLDKNENDMVEDSIVKVESLVKPQTPEELIQAFFGNMSNGEFDDSFALFDRSAQNDQNIRKYFGAFRMVPFFEGIEGKSIEPKNIQKTNEKYKGKDVYTFDISYVLKSTHEKFDETWEFVPGESDGGWKISRIYCITSKCSKHPIFGPEDFGLMR